jgi:hypothetical protein
MIVEQLMRFLVENPTGRFWVGIGAMALGFAIIACDVLFWWKARVAAKRNNLDRRDQFRDRN